MFPSLFILQSRRETAWLLGIPGRALTVHAGFPPILPIQCYHSWPSAVATTAAPPCPPPSSPGRLSLWKQVLGREGEKTGAASLCHPHRLTEMLNLLLSSLSLVTLVCWFLWRSWVQLTSITRPLIHSCNPIPKHSPSCTILKIIYENNRRVSEPL